MRTPKISGILPALELKDEQQDGFRWIVEIEAFRDRICLEMDYVVQLFPEFTPHSCSLHLKHLFAIGDQLLGQELIRELNLAELGILAAAIYAHDWGMAVSQNDKQLIMGASGSATSPSPLQQDFIQFQRFLRSNPMLTPVSAIWQQYVRETHGWRSGLRAREYFKEKDSSLGRAIGAVAAAHVLPISELQDTAEYPTDFSVLGFNANLQALAIYLRLIDLLDFGRDRTPYALWKFVLPKGQLSKMEWAKHQALSPVTFVPYGTSRVVCVDGETDDLAVFARLEDLRSYAGRQIKECLDLLARQQYTRYYLNLAADLQWRVKPINFEPVLAKFEFDAPAMFEMLSTTLYAEDDHVFLRELLQNSIDALRLRQAAVRAKGLDMEGQIDVVVDKTDQGWRLEWSDNGAGFDEYILKNYLARVGANYYRSKDFDKLGLAIDPISRFGIGLLSYFRASDSVLISTFRDPHLDGSKEALEIRIESPLLHFRISRVAQPAAPGTRVILNVRKDRITDLQVVEYLKRIAGFVQFPIRIAESGTDTVITHPRDIDAPVSGSREWHHRLVPSFPWEEAIAPQDIAIAKECLEERFIDLSEDVDLPDCEGWISYIVPTEPAELREFSNAERWIVDRTPGTAQPCVEIRYQERWVRGTADSTMREFSVPGFFRVYHRGILLPKCDYPYHPYPCFCLPSIRINFTASRPINLARTNFDSQNQPENWDSEMWKVVARKLSREYQQPLLAASPKERWYAIGRLLAFHPFRLDYLHLLLPDGSWPFLVLAEDGIDVVESSALPETIELIPRSLHRLLAEPCTSFLFRGISVPTPVHAELLSVVERVECENRTATLTIAEFAAQVELRTIFAESALRFVDLPFLGLPIPVYRMERVSSRTQDSGDWLDRAYANPETLTSREARRLFEAAGVLAEAIPFLHPYHLKFCYGLRVLNLNHPTTQLICRILALFKHFELKRKEIGSAQMGIFKDRIRRSFPGGDGVSYSTFASSFGALVSTAAELGAVKGERDTLIPTREDMLTEWSGDTFLNTQELDRRASRVCQEVVSSGTKIRLVQCRTVKKALRPSDAHT